MIKRFEVGNWYIYKGGIKSFWDPEGKMNKVLDEKPHECIRTNGRQADFKDVPAAPSKFGWSWGELGKWYEVAGPGSEVHDVKSKLTLCGLEGPSVCIFRRDFDGDNIICGVTKEQTDIGCPYVRKVLITIEEDYGD